MTDRDRQILEAAAAVCGITVEDLLQRMFPGEEIDLAKISVKERIKVEKFADDDLTKQPIETIETGD